MNHSGDGWLQLQDVFGDKDIARQLVRQHVIAAQLTLAELTNASAFYMLEGSSAELFYKVNNIELAINRCCVDIDVCVYPQP